MHICALKVCHLQLVLLDRADLENASMQSSISFYLFIFGHTIGAWNTSICHEGSCVLFCKFRFDVNKFRK